MEYILYDSKIWETLRPLTYTRPVCDIRVGILTIQEKWNLWLDTKTSYQTADYLREKYPMNLSEDMLFIDGSVIPNEELVKEILSLQEDEKLYDKQHDFLIAARCSKRYYIQAEEIFNQSKDLDKWTKEIFDSAEKLAKLGGALKEYKGQLDRITSFVSIFKKNGDQIKQDYKLITKGRKSAPLNPTNRYLGEDIFIEEGAKIDFAILNATDGPIYIGKDCTIMDNAVIRGPFAMGEHSVIKMSAKIYGPVTLGPYCKVGGEVSDVVFFGYSNKAHDGYFGDSVIGTWCNVGADSNTSNLKNTYDEIKLWSEEHSTFEPTGETFVGTIMADHVKCGINTMFNTGTVIGVASNVFGAGYQRNYIPSFVWGGTKGIRHDYDVEKAIEVAQAMEKRRNITMSEVDKNILRHIYKITRVHLDH